MEEDDFEAWPMININYSNQNVVEDMPSAAEVAAQRERQLECERELSGLRDGEGEGAGQGEGAGRGAGAEGELSRAVRALRVTSPRLGALLGALSTRLPPAARVLLERPDVEIHLSEMVLGACSLVSQQTETGAWSSEEALGVSALVCVGALAGKGGGGPAWQGGGRPAGQGVGRLEALRALHTLLDRRLDKQHAQEVGAMLVSAMPCPRSLLELSDALASGAGPRTAELSARAALTGLLKLLGGDAGGDDTLQEVSMERVAAAASARWAGLPPSEAYVALQLAGRGLARAARRSEPAARSRLLHALQAPAHPHDAHRPDLLKVMVAASRLRLLFRAEL